MCNEIINIIVEDTVNSTEVNVISEDVSISVDVLESVNSISIEANEQVNEVFVDALTQNYVVEIIADRQFVPDASSTVSGKMKLYDALGSNTDGSVTQNIVKTNFDLKVDKISGYSLTKNNLTDALKALYDVASSWVSTNGTNIINHLSNTSNPHSVTKSQIGLSDVPNTDLTSAVSLNTNKIGITTVQSSDIATNNQKISYTSSLSNLKVDKESGKSIVLDTEIAKISHSNRGSLDLVEGTNTGDQDLSNLAPTAYVDSQDALKVDKVVGKSLLLNTEAVRLTKFSGGRTEIDFGTLPVYQKEFTITDTSVLITSNITASVAYEAPTGKDLDELEMDSLTITCGQATNGTFKILVRSIDNSYLSGKFKINYSITI